MESNTLGKGRDERRTGPRRTATKSDVGKEKDIKNLTDSVGKAKKNCKTGRKKRSEWQELNQ